MRDVKTIEKLLVRVIGRGSWRSHLGSCDLYRCGEIRVWIVVEDEGFCCSRASQRYPAIRNLIMVCVLSRYAMSALDLSGYVAKIRVYVVTATL